MNTRTMEGIAGAASNMELMNVPMRVYREAERRGDTGRMQQAMQYAQDCADRTAEYRKKASEGMELDALEAREREEELQEEAAGKRKLARQEQEERLEQLQQEAKAERLEQPEGQQADGMQQKRTAYRMEQAAVVEISEAGRAMAQEHTHTPAHTEQAAGGAEPL